MGQMTSLLYTFLVPGEITTVNLLKIQRVLYHEESLSMVVVFGNDEYLSLSGIDDDAYNMFLSVWGGALHRNR